MFRDLIKEEIRRALQKFESPLEIKVERPAESKFGDYSTNIAMLLAKDLKKSPLEIAKEILSEIPRQKFIQKITIETPGFINFYLKKEALTSRLTKIVENPEEYGSKPIDPKQKIILEHTDVNPNKPIHVGHLRSACLGDSSVRILKKTGNLTETQYYVDNTGVQVAVTLLGMRHLEKLGIFQENNEKYDHFAGKVYAETVKKLLPLKKYEQEKLRILKDLDDSQSNSNKAYEDQINMILEGNLDTVNKFGIGFDLLVWESDILKAGFWQKTFEILKTNDNFYLSKRGKNKGCWVLKIESAQEKVILKSNGILTYTAKDIAYHFWKFGLIDTDFKYQKWQADRKEKPLWSTNWKGKSNDKFGKGTKVVNFIDVRQSFPQEVINYCLKTTSFEREAQNFHHIGYGLVSLSPKTARKLGVDDENLKTQYAMSGRKGLVITADDLLELVEKEIKKNHPKSSNLRSIAIGAIKYYMLRFNTFSDIVFDLNQALDLYGNTGPYLQYAFARAVNIIKKAKKARKKINFNPKLMAEIEFKAEERELMRQLIYYPEIVEEAANQFSPNIIANYLHELASRFNTFYTRLPVIKCNDEIVFSSRFLMTQATAEVLRSGLDLLGIEALERI